MRSQSCASHARGLSPVEKVAIEYDDAFRPDDNSEGGYDFFEEILVKPWMIWDIERKRAECERENEVAHRLHLPLPLPQDKQWKRPTPARRDEIVT